MPRYFVDTNIAYYAQTNDPRASTAQRILADTYVVSAQVLNELAHSTRRKTNKSWPEIAEMTADLAVSATEIVPLTDQSHVAALQLVQRYTLSFYDALIIAAALEAGCDTLYSEDMQDGLVIDERLTIRNPFAELTPA